MKLKITITILLTVLLCSCKAQHYTPETFPEKQLIFGSGGGMTGVVDTYTLLENGQLFHISSLTKNTIELKRVDKKKAKDLFMQARALEMNALDFDHPGNMYYFLQEKNGDSLSKITWGATGVEVPDAFRSLYSNLTEHLK